MNSDPILRTLAEHNPVTDLPAYDESAESGLRDLLITFRADPAGGARGRRNRLRMTVSAWGAVAVAAGVAVVVIVGAVANQSTSKLVQHVALPPHPTTSSTGRFPAADGTTPVDLVVQRSTLALSDSSGFILRANEGVRGDSTDTPVVFWLDEGDRDNFRLQDLDTQGHLTDELFWFTVDGQRFAAEFDYVKHQYTEGPFSSRLGHGQSGNDATGIAAELRQGHDKVLGTTTINGRTVLWLSNDEPGMNREIWVDASTYLPVRMTAHGSWGSYQIDYTWIPRTADSVTATFTPQIPPGFTKVKQLSRY